MERTYGATIGSPLFVAFLLSLCSLCPPWCKTLITIARRESIAISRFTFAPFLSLCDLCVERSWIRPTAGGRPPKPLHGALHGPCQRTKLPDTTYGAYALKPYNI